MIYQACGLDKKEVPFGRQKVLLFWPVRRDSNPRSSESESAALSNCATDGYIKHYNIICFVFQELIKSLLCRLELKYTPLHKIPNIVYKMYKKTLQIQIFVLL